MRSKETGHAPFESAVVGMYILTVEGVVHNANISTEIERSQSRAINTGSMFYEVGGEFAFLR